MWKRQAEKEVKLHENDKDGGERCEAVNPWTLITFRFTFRLQAGQCRLLPLTPRNPSEACFGIPTGVCRQNNHAGSLHKCQGLCPLKKEIKLMFFYRTLAFISLGSLSRER